MAQRRRLAEKDPKDHTRLPSFGHPCLHKGYSAVYRRQDRSINRDDSSVTLVGRCVTSHHADDAQRMECAVKSEHYAGGTAVTTAATW
jgi:hypothetical protein